MSDDKAAPPVVAGEYDADDLAVDQFAAAMKEKLTKKRAEGRTGWWNKFICTNGFLSKLLRDHVEKGDPVDVANFAMMLHQRGERIAGGRMSDENNAAPSAAPGEYDGLMKRLRDKWQHSEEDCYAAAALAAMQARVSEAEGWSNRFGQELDKARAAMPDQFILDPPDGGDVKLHEAVERVVDALAAAQARIAALTEALDDSELRFVKRVLEDEHSEYHDRKPALDIIHKLRVTARAALKGGE